MAIPARPMKGIEHPAAISSIDFFSGRHNSCPASAIVVDDVGHYEGIAVAAAPIERGSDVTFVTRHTRSEEHGDGNVCVSTGRSRWSTETVKTKRTLYNPLVETQKTKQKK